jgi:hypothetical protein
MTDWTKDTYTDLSTPSLPLTFLISTERQIQFDWNTSASMYLHVDGFPQISTFRPKLHILRDHLQIIRPKSETKRNGFPFLPDFKIHS